MTNQILVLIQSLLNPSGDSDIVVCIKNYRALATLEATSSSKVFDTLSVPKYVSNNAFNNGRESIVARIEVGGVSVVASSDMET